jgi:glycine/D-amino acid oxidase-like deaminating enzyme
VAGHVRQGLNDAGFVTQKTEGFGRKAEMLTGYRPGNWQPVFKNKTSVAVLGTGVAGMACARALQRRDLDVRLISNDHPNAASNIPHLTTCAQLGLHSETRYQFSLSANEYVQYANSNFNTCGLHWHSNNASQSARMANIADQFPDDFMKSEAGSVHFRNAGWLRNEIPDISIHHKSRVEEIRYLDGLWEIYSDNGKLVTRVNHLVSRWECKRQKSSMFP